MRATGIFLAAWFLAVSGPFAQEIEGNIDQSFPILSVGVGARAVAMGESFVALADDATAVYWNAAGLGQLSEHQITFLHHSYVQGCSYETVFYVNPLRGGSGLGFSASYLDYGPFERRDESGQLTGQYNPNDLALSAAYGRSLGTKWLLGLRSAWMRQAIDDSRHSALAWDFGVLWKPNHQFRAGVNFKSLGVDSSGDSLPTEIKTGISYQLNVGDKKQHVLIYGAGLDILTEGIGRANAGIEYQFSRIFSGRAGSIIDLGHNPQDWKKGLSFGAGSRFDSFQMDYAFTFGGDLGDSHRFALSAYWGAGAPSVSGSSGSGGPGAHSDSEGVHSSNPVTLTFEVPVRECDNIKDCFDRALDLEKKGHRSEALLYYLKVVEKEPKQEAAWLRIGRLYYILGRDAFEKALEANPENGPLQKWLEDNPR